MSDPGTMALIFTAASAGISAYATIQQGRAAEAEAETEQEIYNFNAQQKLEQAKEQRYYTEEEAEKFERRGKRFISTQRAGYARGGVLAEGTPAFILEQTAQDLEADRMEILRQGFLESKYLVSEARGMVMQGQAARARGENIRRGSLLTAGAGLASGLADIGLAQYKFNQGKLD